MHESITLEPPGLSLPLDTDRETRCHDGRDLPVVLAVHLVGLPDAEFACVFPIRIQLRRCHEPFEVGR